MLDGLIEMAFKIGLDSYMCDHLLAMKNEGKKAEIEALECTPTFLTSSYLPGKLAAFGVAENNSLSQSVSSCTICL